MIKAFDIFSLHASGDLPDDTENEEPAATDEIDTADAEELLASEQQIGVVNFVSEEGIDQPEAELLSAHRLPCTVHTLQLVIKNALQQVPAVDKVIKEASSVVGFFHRSLHWGCELKKLSGGLKLLSAVPTRWNSFLIILRRLSDETVYRAVKEALKRARTAKPPTSAPQLITTRAQLVDLVGLLENFEEATNTLQGDGVTISMVIPAIVGIDEQSLDRKRSFKLFSYNCAVHYNADSTAF